ncbi:hypothetical protein ABKN59_009172 [Abortiporus biennis]
MSEPTLPPADQIHPSFNLVNLINDYPHLFGHLLQQAWDERHPQLHPLVRLLIDRLHMGASDTQQLITCLAGDLPKTVVDIALDDRLYNLNLSLHMDKQSTWNIDVTIGILRILLMCMMKMMEHAIREPVCLQSTISIFQIKIPSIIEML